MCPLIRFQRLEATGIFTWFRCSGGLKYILPMQQNKQSRLSADKKIPFGVRAKTALNIL